MDNGECVQSICSIQFESDPLTYYAVGTAYAFEGEDEILKGRILIFHVDENSKAIRLVHSFTTKGAVYQVLEMNGMLVAGVNSMVKYMEALMRPRPNELNFSRFPLLRVVY